MKNAKLSIQVFAVYLVLLGAALLIIPNTILTVFGFAETSEPWIRILGAVVVALGYYYLRAASVNMEAFYLWTVHVRWVIAVVLVALVVLNLALANLLLFAVPDALGGLWTFYALRSKTT